MNCESVKKMLLEGETKTSENLEVTEHLKNCEECLSFSSNIKTAESQLAMLKNSKPILNEPELLSLSILNQIRSEQKKDILQPSILDAILNWFMLKQVRLALYSVLFLFSSLYFYEEAVALKNVVALESNLNNAGQQYEASISDNMPNLSFFYDIYKLIAGEKKHLNLSKEWLVVNKSFIKGLLGEYNSLTPEKKIKVDELKKKLTKEQTEFLDELMNVKKN
ncbi:MAG: hypothetical protein WCZ90_14740 [Melioribacteraceae bacterium]